MRAFDGDSGDTGVPFDRGGGGRGQRAVELPEGVGGTAAGAELAAMLESVSVEQVSGYDTVEYLKAAYRLVNHFQGVFLKALLETGVRLPAPDDQVVRTEMPGEFASEEARAALVWSRSRAEGTLGRAYQLFGQTSAVGDALISGSIDEPRAKAFVDWTAGLSEEHTTRVVDDLLPVAPKVTVGGLIDRIKKLAIALDPEWAERRYRESLKQRRVELRQTQSGTADLAGRDLPADRAKTGADRIHALAMACKKAGDKRRIDLVRADIYLGMLDGLFQHMTDEQIVENVLANPVADDHTDNDHTDDDNPGGDGSGPAPGGDDGPGDDGGGGYPSRGDHGTGEADNGGPSGDSGPGSGGDSGPGSGGRGGPGNRPSGNDPCGESPPDDGSGGRGASAQSPGRSAWNVRELRAELTTILGLDDHPAELPGVGYVPASVARENVALMASGEWRFVICAPDGVPICSGITTRRPTSRRHVRRDPKRGGILELQLTTAQLDQLATDVASGQHSDWADVITDIADRYHRGIVDGRDAANTAEAESGVDTTRAPVDIGQVADDVRRRFARAGLRRWVEARARYCQHPACRMPATQCDHDHRTDYAYGGLTVDANLDPGCRHDHRLQHDGGWVVYRPPGSDPLTGPIVWVSPLGHEYESRPPPVMQPYPEPGHYYPGHDTLPDWFLKITEHAKAERTNASTGDPDSVGGGGEIRRPTKPSREVPPF